MKRETAGSEAADRSWVTMSCPLRRSQAKALEHLARRQDVPASILVRQAVDHLLAGAGVVESGADEGRGS